MILKIVTCGLAQGNEEETPRHRRQKGNAKSKQEAKLWGLWAWGVFRLWSCYWCRYRAPARQAGKSRAPCRNQAPTAVPDIECGQGKLLVIQGSRQGNKGKMFYQLHNTEAPSQETNSKICPWPSRSLWPWQRQYTSSPTYTTPEAIAPSEDGLAAPYDKSYDNRWKKMENKQED